MKKTKFILEMQVAAGIITKNQMFEELESNQTIANILNTYILGQGDGDWGVFKNGDTITYEWSKEDAIENDVVKLYDKAYEDIKNQGGKIIDSSVPGYDVTYTIGPDYIKGSYIYDDTI